VGFTGDHPAVRQRLIVGGLVAVALIGLAAAALFAGVLSPPHVIHHDDGEGPLGSEGGAGYHITSARDPQGGRYTSWTDGVRLCLFSGTEAAILDDVSPRATVGTGFEFLGARVREFTYEPLVHSFIESTFGFPPSTTDVPDPLYEVAGFAVTSPCSQPPSGSYTELLIGLAMVGDDGGGWQGVDVAYSVGGQSYVLFIDEDLLICGRSTPLCPPATATPSP
jgi:hypothetical protein